MHGGAVGRAPAVPCCAFVDAGCTHLFEPARSGDVSAIMRITYPAFRYRPGNRMKWMDLALQD